MRFSLFKEYGALNSKPVFEAFEHSLRQAGHTVCESDMHSDVAVIWSVLWNSRMLGNKPIWEYYRKTNRNVIVLEVGGIKRGTTWKVGLNGVNRDAFFSINGNDNSRVVKIGLKLNPWRTNGEFILICGQHDKSLQWKNQKPISEWFTKTIEKIQSISNRPIIIRPHPRCRVDSIEQQYRNVYRQDPLHISGTYDSFNLDFKRIWATISYNSNPGPQSIIAGIPAFVSTSSLAYPVGNDIDFLHDIENPLMPDRSQWLNDYAWTEYTIDEIASGLPLKRLTNNIF